MKAFWWFEDDAIAGMARPGFNGTPWFDLSFEEAVLIGWIGQYSSGATSLSDFRVHAQAYGSKILKFYGVSGDAVVKALQVFSEREGLERIFQRITDEVKLLQSYRITDTDMHFEFNRGQLEREIKTLKEKGIRKVVALTEKHHDRDALSEQFEVFHFSIDDLGSPSLDQVRALAEIIRTAKSQNEKVAVHCLAGIGRTSTMLIGAQMILGKTLDEMKVTIAKKNPVFVLAGKQAEFLQSLAAQTKVT